MRFDLQFLDRPSPEGDWAEALADVAGMAWSNEPLSPADIARWDELVGGLDDVLPDASSFATLTRRELADAETGVELVFHPGELRLAVADLAGSAIDAEVAERLALVRVVTARIEAVTGLTAINPTTEAPFLTAERPGPPDEAEPDETVPDETQPHEAGPGDLDTDWRTPTA